MSIGWGWKIAGLYGGFVVMVLCLVVGSSRQQSDLVSKNYYAAELGYQKVIDAGKNQSALSAPLLVHADENMVTIDFPEEFRNRALSGDVTFYAPVNAKWDRNFKISATDNKMVVPRSALERTRYVVKINCIADGVSYYQESALMLHSR